MFSIDVLRRAPSPCWRDQQNLEWSEQKCKLETVVWSKIEVFQNWCVKATYVYLKNRWAQVLHERVKILTWVFLLQINYRYISVSSPLINFCTSHGNWNWNLISPREHSILHPPPGGRAERGGAGVVAPPSLPRDVRSWESPEMLGKSVSCARIHRALFI